MEAIEIFGRATATKIEGGSSAVIKIINQEVRPASAKDWPAILTMANMLWRLDTTQSNAIIPDNANVFVAESDKGELIGMVVCHQPSDGMMPLSHLYVAEEHRGHGIGTALLQSAIAFAGDKTEIFLMVNRSNTRLRRFYSCFGFEPAPLIGLRRPAA
jgi:ribosomal protein S18 acetylase RimI-like enzyme